MTLQLLSCCGPSRYYVILEVNALRPPARPSVRRRLVGSSYTTRREARRYNHFLVVAKAAKGKETKMAMPIPILIANDSEYDDTERASQPARQTDGFIIFVHARLEKRKKSERWSESYKCGLASNRNSICLVRLPK